MKVEIKNTLLLKILKCLMLKDIFIFLATGTYNEVDNLLGKRVHLKYWVFVGGVV